MYKLKINLFGEYWMLKKITASEEQMLSWESISLKMKKPLYEVLTDPFFYYLLQDNNIMSVDDLTGKIWEGLLNTPKNQIEIWFKNKKVKKMNINDLNEELVLFPLYNISLKKLPQKKEKGFYIFQKGIGLIGTYETNIVDFYIDNLEFQIFDANGITILQNLKYNDQLLNLKKNDILITYQYGFIKN